MGGTPILGQKPEDDAQLAAALDHNDKLFLLANIHRGGGLTKICGLSGLRFHGLHLLRPGLVGQTVLFAEPVGLGQYHQVFASDSGKAHAEGVEARLSVLAREARGKVNVVPLYPIANVCRGFGGDGL